MEDNARASVEAYVDAAAALLTMPLEPAHRPIVVDTMVRIATFAADVAAVPLGIDVEIAGSFVP